MKRVFVICNGESRKGFDLEELRQYGKVYGCNALYRDFTPDALIAVDDRIVHKIYWSGYPLENQCYFRDWVRMPANAFEMLTAPEMISGVRASSIRTLSTSSTTAKACPLWACSSGRRAILSRR